MIGVYIKCDEPGCQEERRDWQPRANKSDLAFYARHAGWQVGKEKHFCPQHRKVKKKVEPYDPADDERFLRYQYQGKP